MRPETPWTTTMALSLSLSVAVAACAHSPMIAATSEFATAAKTSVQQLGAGPRMVVDLCWQSAEVKYVENAVLPGAEKVAFHDWLDLPQDPATAGAPSSWRQICAQYRLADNGFQRGLEAIAAYADALGAVATQIDKKADLNGLASSVAADAAGLSGKAARYKDAIGGVGQPLGELATALVGHWEQEKLRVLVAKTDTPFHNLIRQLLAFVTVARGEQLTEVRNDLGDFTQALRKGERVPASDKYTAAYIEVEITRRLDRIAVKLATIVELLNKLAQAHTLLKDGWQHDEAGAIDTIKAIAVLAKDVYGSVQAFQNPQTGDNP